MKCNRNGCTLLSRKMWRQLFLQCLLLKATSPQITSFGDTTVEYGKDAYYKCELQNQKGVHQITWQKRLRDNPVENIGSYSEPFGQHINKLYQGKAILNETSLSSASLTLKNVMWADECCYICIFNVYPGDSKRKQTCLTVQGISELKAKVYNPESDLANGTATVVFSCSATGKPAPTIRWHFSPKSAALHQTTPTTVANRDGTFTRSQNVTLHLTESWDGHAECVVQSGGWGERMERVPFSWDAGLEKMVEDRETGGGMSKTGQTLVVFVVAVVAAAAGMALIVIIVREWKRHDVLKHDVYRRTVSHLNHEHIATTGRTV